METNRIIPEEAYENPLDEDWDNEITKKQKGGDKNARRIKRKEK